MILQTFFPLRLGLPGFEILMPQRSDAQSPQIDGEYALCRASYLLRLHVHLQTARLYSYCLLSVAAQEAQYARHQSFELSICSCTSPFT